MNKFQQYILEDAKPTTIEDIKGVPDEVKEAIQSLVKYMIDKGIKIKPLPMVNFIDDDEENANKLLGDTGNYDQENKIITVYTKKRLPEDYIRSFCHEMIHHIQNIEGRLHHTDTENVTKDSQLEELESEANRRGNMIFRAWKDETIKRD